MNEQAMRLAAGYLSATMLLLLIGYVIGYAVCLWRYQPSPERSTAEFPEWLEANRIELEGSAEHVYEQSPPISDVHVKDD